VPPAATVLRRALLVWGAGHLALGERLGWLLVLVQPVALAGLLLLAALVLDGSRWILLFPAVALVLATWLGQAMHAQRLAISRGAEPGGEFQIVVALPLVIIALSGFWLIGGGRASPAATVQHYVSAWQSDRPETVAHLFAEPPSAQALGADWQSQRLRIERLVREAAARHGPLAGLNPNQPFNSLRFEEASRTADGRATVVVDVVRRRRVETSLFGLVPTATQETVRVERLGRISLRAHPARGPDWLPLDAIGQVWLIEEVSFQEDS
jgi:hypothetical protein